MKKNTGFLYSEDKIALSFEHERNGFDTVIIICPGFFNSKKNRWMRKATEILSRDYDTIVFDFRGHGSSQGRFTWSAKEHLDLKAVIKYAKEQNYSRIGILAFSLGAAASINTASQMDGAVKSMILISSPCDFWEINCHFWEPEVLSDLKDNIECEWEGKGARVASLFLRKRKPLTEIGKIKKTAMFFIHGTRDWIIKDYHSRKLYKACQSRKKIELINNGLHAERLIQQYPRKMSDLILSWFRETLF